MSNQEYRYRTVRTKDLVVGMYVEDVGRSWLQHPWLTQKKLITSKNQIQQLLEYDIKEVVVNLSLGVTPKRIAPEDPPVKEPQPEAMEEVEHRQGPRPEVITDEVPLEQEIPRVRETFYHSAGAVGYMVDKARSGAGIDLKLVNRVAGDIIESVFRNRDAFLALAKVKVYEKYDFAHPLLVTVLAVSFGRYLGMNREQLEILGQATMLQDIGKTMIPHQILDKPSGLTVDEYDVAKKHAVIGAKMLKTCEGLHPLALKAALRHHERLDGSGYPGGLSGDQVDPFMIISGLADVFDALSADKVYKKGMTPYEALRTMFTMRGKEFPALWLDRFIHCLGIYPTGTTVKLNTGESAVVVRVNHAQLLRPVVKLATDSQGRPLSKIRTIDLNLMSQEHRSVRSVIDPQQYGINPAKYVDPTDDL